MMVSDPHVMCAMFLNQLLMKFFHLRNTYNRNVVTLYSTQYRWVWGLVSGRQVEVQVFLASSQLCVHVGCNVRRSTWMSGLVTGISVKFDLKAVD